MTEDAGLGLIKAEPRRGDESFHDAGHALGFDVGGFWRWSFSDLVSNATRGIVAEYLVAEALGVAVGVREEWAAHDLTMPDGTRVEVKSSGYIQSWFQKRLSAITFGVRKTRAWSASTNRQEDELKRQADVYVFAVQAHEDQATLDPLDVSQWEFYVVPTAHLDARTRSQHSITLRSLKGLAGPGIGFRQLKSAVLAAGLLQRSLVEQVNGSRP